MWDMKEPLGTTIFVSHPSRKASLCHSGGGGGGGWGMGEMSRKGTSQCNQWVLVRSSPHWAGLDSVKLKADKASGCKKTVLNFLTKGIPF